MTASEHEPERELQELQDQADSLGDRISDARDDWESKKADASVPGADPDPDSRESEDAEATAYPAKGSSDKFGEDLEEASSEDG